MQAAIVREAALSVKKVLEEEKKNNDSGNAKRLKKIEDLNDYESYSSDAESSHEYILVKKVKKIVKGGNMIAKSSKIIKKEP